MARFIGHLWCLCSYSCTLAVHRILLQHLLLVWLMFPRAIGAVGFSTLAGSQRLLSLLLATPRTWSQSHTESISQEGMSWLDPSPAHRRPPPKVPFSSAACLLLYLISDFSHLSIVSSTEMPESYNGCRRNLNFDHEDTRHFIWPPVSFLGNILVFCHW